MAPVRHRLDAGKAWHSVNPAATGKVSGYAALKVNHAAAMTLGAAACLSKFEAYISAHW